MLKTTTWIDCLPSPVLIAAKHLHQLPPPKLALVLDRVLEVFCVIKEIQVDGRRKTANEESALQRSSAEAQQDLQDSHAFAELLGVVLGPTVDDVWLLFGKEDYVRAVARILVY
jgi:hypothetical protein